MFARVVNGEVEYGFVGPLPSRAQRLADGEWIEPPNGEWTLDLAASCGWLPVVQTPRPEDTREVRYIPAPPIVQNGFPVQQWASRPWTSGEIRVNRRWMVRLAARDSLVDTALTWLREDSAEASKRVQQIESALAAVDDQISAITDYTFTGTTIAAIKASLNNALKPQILAILQRQRQIGIQLQELNVARDRHGDALTWLGKFVVGESEPGA